MILQTGSNMVINEHEKTSDWEVTLIEWSGQ